MQLNDLIGLMDALAPRETALSFDNSGLVVAPERSEIRRVLVALDCTVDVAKEAVRLGADLVLTHHPLLFNAVKRISPDSPDTAAIYLLIRNGIGLFSAHTNLDAAEGGVNTALCRLLGIRDEEAIPPDNIMRIGRLDNSIMLDELAHLVEEKLHTTALIAGSNRPVSRVAVMGGSGGGDYNLAKENGADVYITGECKHSQAINAGTLGLAIIVAGHHETEYPVLVPLIEYLQASNDDVEYILSDCGKTVFRTLDRK